MLPPEEIETRKPVWLTMSEFYLDTDLDEDELLRISSTFKESGYSIGELREIDYYNLNAPGYWKKIKL